MRRITIALAVLVLLVGAIAAFDRAEPTAAMPGAAPSLASPVANTPSVPPSPGLAACIPVKGQRQLPDLATTGLNAAGDAALVANVGCAPNQTGFTVWMSLFDGELTVIELIPVPASLAPGQSVEIPFSVDCAFTRLTVEIDPDGHVAESSRRNNTGFFGVNHC